MQKQKPQKKEQAKQGKKKAATPDPRQGQEWLADIRSSGL